MANKKAEMAQKDKEAAIIKCGSLQKEVGNGRESREATTNILLSIRSNN